MSNISRRFAAVALGAGVGDVRRASGIRREHAGKNPERGRRSGLPSMWPIRHSASSTRRGQPDGSDVAVGASACQGPRLPMIEVRAGAVHGPHSGLGWRGRADVTIASISVTSDRAKAVMYCNPNGALSITIFAPQQVTIKTPADLVGKRIGITRATLEEATVPKMAPEGTKIVWFDDLASTVQALLSGQVDAAAMTSFAEKTVSDANPGKRLENKLLVTTAFYGPIVRPGDFRAAPVDQHLALPQQAERHARRDLQEIHRRRPGAAADLLGRGDAPSLNQTGSMHYAFHFNVVWGPLARPGRGGLADDPALVAGDAARSRTGDGCASTPRRPGPGPVRWAIATYIELIRNTPFLVQIFIVYFSLPAMGISVGANEAALAAMVVNFGAYGTEILRARNRLDRPGSDRCGRGARLEPACRRFVMSSCSRP